MADRENGIENYFLKSAFICIRTSVAPSFCQVRRRVFRREEPELVVNGINQVVQAATKEKQRQDHEAEMAALKDKMMQAAAYLKQLKEPKAEAAVFEALKICGFDERTINTVACQQLSRLDKADSALSTFKYNTFQYP